MQRYRKLVVFALIAVIIIVIAGVIYIYINLRSNSNFPQQWPPLFDGSVNETQNGCEITVIKSRTAESISIKDCNWMIYIPQGDGVDEIAKGGFTTNSTVISYLDKDSSNTITIGDVFKINYPTHTYSLIMFEVTRGNTLVLRESF